MTPSVRTHLDALKAALDVVMTAYRVDDIPATPARPYAFVVYGGGGSLDGPVSAPDDDGEMVVQVTYVGDGTQQSEWLLDKGRALLLGVATFTVAGRRIGRVRLDLHEPSQPDNKVSPPVYYAVDRYRIFTTPEA